MPTIDMASWPEREVDVLHGILLDPENVRLGVGSEADQPEVMVDLFANENAMELVGSILQVGFLTLEAVIAVERGTDLVMVEGNRRLAALKAIQNPELAPSQFGGRIKKLVDETTVDLKSLERISVRVAPDREKANRLIAIVHTGRQRRPWSRARQAEFFQAQVDEGKSVSDLVAQFPTVNVRDLLIRSSVLQRLREVDYVNPEIEKYVNSGKFPVTVLERLYPNQEFRELVGLTIDTDSATARVVSKKKDFASMAERLVADIKDKKISTRTLNRVESREYKETLRVLAEAMGKSTPGEDGQPQPARRVSTVARTTVKPSRLDGVEDIKIREGLMPSVYVIHEELKTLNVRVHSNAAVTLLRTFLEKAIKAFARTSPRGVLFTDRGGRKQLSHMLDWLANYYGSHDHDLQQAVRALKNTSYGTSDGSGVVVRERLDAVNHNPAIIATGADAHDLWNAICPIIKDMLEPQS